MGNAYKILIGTPERRRLLGRPRHRWKITVEWILEKQSGKV
jgi:hypothetical protein